MQREARAAGEEVIAAEAALDELFAKRRVDAASLAQGTTRAAAALGRLRETHLRYHLSMMDVLSPEQVARYNRLRGY
jgi:Spy/CpxP family protein refolding chaperone